MKQIIYLFLLSIMALVAVNGQTVHPNFTLEKYADKIPGARALTFDQQGNIYVSSRQGAIVRINKDKTLTKIAEGFTLPFGLDLYKNSTLIVSSVTTLYLIQNVQELQTPITPQTAMILAEDLPYSTWHNGRYLRIFGDTLVVSIGVPFDTGTVVNPFGTLVAYDLKQKKYPLKFKTIAYGLRNSVGFDVMPGRTVYDGHLFFTDNGQDNLGMLAPFDEINQLATLGSHFGFPFYASNIMVKSFSPPKDLRPIFPVYNLEAHGAALGASFYPTNQFGDLLKNALLVAQHGSLGSITPKAGYAIKAILRDSENRAFTTSVTLVNFLVNNQVTGRPVDVKIAPSGDIFFTDDFNGAVWHLKNITPLN